MKSVSLLAPFGRFVEIGKGVIEIGLAEIDIAAIEVGRSRIAIEPHGFIAIGQRPIGILFRPPPSAAAAQGAGAILRRHPGVTDDAIAGRNSLIGLVEFAGELATIEIGLICRRCLVERDRKRSQRARKH